MTLDLIRATEQLAEALTESLDGDERISYLDVLDALALCGVTLTVDTGREASQNYFQAAEMEGALANS